MIVFKILLLTCRAAQLSICLLGGVAGAAPPPYSVVFSRQVTFGCPCDSKSEIRRPCLLSMCAKTLEQYPTVNGSSWLSGSVGDVQARDRVFDPRPRWVCSDVVLVGKALCSHVHPLDPGVSGYLIGQWNLCVWIVPCAENGSRAVCCPGSRDGLYEPTGPMTRG